MKKLVFTAVMLAAAGVSAALGAEVKTYEASWESLNTRPLATMPERATLLNTGKALNARVELMPWNVGSFNRETLHVWGIPADSLANECIVIRLDFAPGVVDGKLQFDREDK